MLSPIQGPVGWTPHRPQAQSLPCKLAQRKENKWLISQTLWSSLFFKKAFHVIFILY